MTFGQPDLLLLLLLVPLLAWLQGRAGEPPAFIYSSVRLVQQVHNLKRSRAGAFLTALRHLALALMIFALSQPRLTRSETTIKASGVDIVVAFDLSGSMQSEDFQVAGRRVNRFNMARLVLKEFIEKRPNDRIGLVVFATDAYIATPLTLDHDFLLKNLDRLSIGAINENKTAIGSGLATAVNRVRDLPAKSKIVILMTDGQNNSGTIAPLNAAEAAKALKVKVYTIGVGMKGQAPMPRGRNPFTGEIVYEWIPVDIDEETLQKVAQMTGGNYYRADNTEKFRSIYSEIDKLEKTEAEVKKYAQHRELFAWVLIPGIGLVLLETLLKHSVLRRLP